MIRPPLIVANWKMHGQPAMCRTFAHELRTFMHAGNIRPQLVICPPSILLPQWASLTPPAVWSLGGQDCHAHADGPHTGDISAEMLAEQGCRYVLVGHSERRTAYRESNAQVGDKTQAVLRANMTPIVCVGESLAVRKSGHAQSFVAEQLRHILPPATPGVELVVAYEPVWAIGRGLAARPSDIAAMHRCIRDLLGNAGRVLYGGSVSTENVRELAEIDEVEGVLVGGASLRAQDFWTIGVTMQQTCQTSPRQRV